MVRKYSAFFLLLAMLPASAAVRVWQGTLPLPTYEEGLPDVNPPFDQFAPHGRYNYPYTLRTNISDKRVVRDWRALFLENEYLKCSVLPDIGGHLYTCTDKINGKDMFYANPSIKKALIGYRGAWAAFGDEFNFPVSHNWVSMSPVDFATREYPDGSASVIVGNIDRPYGMEWRIEMILRPGSTVLEQKVTLYNRADVRRRYYWWNNAAARVEDDTKICYPMRFTASHGFTNVDTWPVNHAGLDLSVVRNHTAGPVSEFVHGSREPFMAVYHPQAKAGLAHYANYGDVPAKKIWSWGVDPDGLDWRKTLSDDNSGYVEVQAGLFRNQETYAFLAPQDTLRFSEYWMPVRDIGGISRANLYGVVNLSREGGRLRAGLNVNETIKNARVRLLDGKRVLLTATETLDPSKSFTRDLPNAPAGKVTFELSDANGKPLLVHTEGTYDWTPASEIKVGPQPPVRRENDPLEMGSDQEVNGDLLGAWQTYQNALARDKDNFELNRAAGRLAVTLKRYDDAVPLLQKAQERASNDPEVQYYLGCAYAALGETRKARTEWEGAQRQPYLRPGARLELARVAAREGGTDEALRLLKAAIAERPYMLRAGALEVALLRAAGRESEAREVLNHWLGEDPSDSFLRIESTKLGKTDEALWRHLGADPERVLGAASDYVEIGQYRDALDLLSRDYPKPGELETEPGALLPQEHPIVAYYRAWCREKLGQSASADYAAASKMSTRFVFPNRPMTETVLRRAIEVNGQDATAHFLLGELLMSANMVDSALKEWQTARSINKDLPVLHRNLGKTLLVVKRDDAAALEVYREGLKVDRNNVELYEGTNQALALLGRPASERADTILAYPDQAALPTPLAFDLALSLAEAGRIDQAEGVFKNRFFAREEGGTNVREVYVEVELRKARALAKAGRGAEAEKVLAAIGKPVPGLAFTNDGMEPFVKNARFEYLAGEVEALAGSKAAAAERWKRASAERGAYSVLASRDLGNNGWREAAEKMLSRPRMGGAERGLLLEALGRDADAKEELQRILRQPDRRLSHYFARTAMLKRE